MLENKRILLIVSGGIAAVKVPDLIRRLRERAGKMHALAFSAGEAGQRPIGQVGSGRIGVHGIEPTMQAVHGPAGIVAFVDGVVGDAAKRIQRNRGVAQAARRKVVSLRRK